MTRSHAFGTVALMSATSCFVRADLSPLRRSQLLSPRDDIDAEGSEDVDEDEDDGRALSF